MCVIRGCGMWASGDIQIVKKRSFDKRALEGGKGGNG
jgi:hypothetical protein